MRNINCPKYDHCLTIHAHANTEMDCKYHCPDKQNHDRDLNEFEAFLAAWGRDHKREISQILYRLRTAHKYNNPNADTVAAGQTTRITHFFVGF